LTEQVFSIQDETEEILGHNNGHYDYNNERHGSKQYKRSEEVSEV
jgi:hypothetical protein